MGSTNIDPGGGGTNSHSSYARSLKSTKFQRLNRNVLEIILEKKVLQKAVNVSCDDVSKICDIVGIKVGSEAQVYQAHYNGTTITLSIWAKDGIGLDKFVS